jgi:sugar phosphate isomerase/epimerase
MKLGMSTMTLVPRCVLKGIPYLKIKSEKTANKKLEIPQTDTLEFSDYELVFLNWVNESLEFAEKERFDFLEVIIESPLNSRPEIQVGFVKLCNSYKIPKTVHAPFLHNNIIFSDDYLRDGSIKEYFNSFDLARKIHASKVTIHPGIPHLKLPFILESQRQFFPESIKILGDYYLNHYEHDLVVCIENMPKSVGLFIDNNEIRRYFNTQEFKSYKMTIDSSHAWTCGDNKNMQDLILKMKDKIAHVHVVDNETFDSDPHIPIGKGKIDFNLFIKCLQEINYNDTMVIELPGCNSTLESRDAIRKLL